VWRIGFGVMGMELVGVMQRVQGFVRCDAMLHFSKILEEPRRI
jgi:hypothetical protein